MKIALVLTTINVPHLLTEYRKQGPDVQFIVAGDVKTPPEARTFCEGIGAEYMGVEEQEAFLEPYSELKAYLPWNSVQRRNVAILKAYREGADVIITIDDDNFCDDEAYFEPFNFLGVGSNGPAVSSMRKWYNPIAHNYVYPRGYSFRERSVLDQATHHDNISGRIVVQAGFWNGEPDIDAVTRISFAPLNLNFKETTIYPGTWCPFNSQNTGIHRDVIPAYFLSPHIGRYDDIWASYIVQRLTMENRDLVSFGRPYVRQKRNQHDLFKDLELEMFGMRHTDDFCDQLRAATITKKGYKDGCLELLDQINGSQYEEFIRGYRIWLSLF